MSDPIEALILDLLEWIGPTARPHSEVMDAWRTSCPRLPVWEEANERGFVERRDQLGRGTFIIVTALGREFLDKHRPHRLVPLDAFDGDRELVSTPPNKPVQPTRAAEPNGRRELSRRGPRG